MNLPDTSRLTFDLKKHAYLLDGIKHLTGVTTVLSATSDKAQLINWAANMAVDHIKNHPDVQSASEGHDGEEPTGSWLYDVPEYVLEEARTAHAKKKEAAGSKGTNTHALVEEYIKGLIHHPQDGVEYTSSIRPFVEWAKIEVDYFLAAEQKLFDEENAIGGTADFFYISKKGELVAGDLKTYPVMWSPDAYCQTGIYARMWRLLMGDQATKSVVVKMCDPTDERLKKYGADAFAVYPRYALQEDEEMFLKRLDVYRYNQNYTKPSK